MVTSIAAMSASNASTSGLLLQHTALCTDDIPLKVCGEACGSDKLPYLISKTVPIFLR